MELQQRVRGVVLAQVHTLGGNLVRLGEGLQGLARPPALIAAQQAARLIGREGSAAPQVVVEPEVALARPALESSAVATPSVAAPIVDPIPEPVIELSAPETQAAVLEEPVLEEEVAAAPDAPQGAAAQGPKVPSRKGKKARRR